MGEEPAQRGRLFAVPKSHEHIVRQCAHLGLGVPRVCGKRELAHGCAHRVRPIADRALQLSPTILLIPGTTSGAHLTENLAAAEVRLTDEAMRTLGRLDKS